MSPLMPPPSVALALLFAVLLQPHAANEAIGALREPSTDSLSFFESSAHKPWLHHFGTDAGHVGLSDSTEKDDAGFFRTVELGNVSSDPSTPVVGEVQDEFVRKCTVALSVRNKKLLPVDALERFCSTTDAVMECKLKLSMRLETVHEQGGSTEAFCQAAYDWVKNKYGMLCPLQCHKLQCRSTCMWLEEKKRLTTAAKEVEAENFQASVLRAELKKAQSVAEHAEKKLYESNRTVILARLTVERAEKRVNDRSKYLEAAQEKVENLTARIKSLEESLSETGAIIRAETAEISKLQMNLDKVELRYFQLMKNAHNIGSKIIMVTNHLEKLPVVVATKQKELDERLLATQELYQAISVLTNMTKDQELVVQKWAEAWKRADKQVVEAKSRNSPERIVTNFEDMRRQQEARLRIEVGTLEKARRYIDRLEKEGKRYMKEVDVLVKYLDESKVLTARLIEEVAAMIQQLQKVEAEARSLAEKEMVGLVAELTQKRAAVGKTTQEHLHVNRTLTIVLGVHEEEAKRLQTEVQFVKKWREEVKASELALTKAEEEFKKSEQANKSAKQEEEGIRKRWEELNSGLANRIQENELALRKLNRWKPDIVTTHGLGLWQTLLRW